MCVIHATENKLK